MRRESVNVSFPASSGWAGAVWSNLPCAHDCVHGRQFEKAAKNRGAFAKEVDTAVGDNVFYGSLSTQANKSEACCKRIIEILAIRISSTRRDALRVVCRKAWRRSNTSWSPMPMLRVIESRSGSGLRRNALRCIASYVSDAHVKGVKA